MKYLLLLSILFASSAFADEFEDTLSRAEAGDADAQLMLGFMYDFGIRAPQDYSEAVKWYRAAAEQGNAEGQSALGGKYRAGVGVPQDYSEAVKWYRAAAEKGHVHSQVTLGFLYYHGHGVLEDYIRAHMWYNIASANGNDISREHRNTLSEEMTSSQIEQAQKMAKVCLSSDYEDC